MSNSQQPESPRPSVGIFLPSLVGGGAERMMLNLAAGLQGAGCDVDLVLASVSGSYVEMISSDINVVDLKRSSVSAAVPGLVRYLRSRRPKAVVSSLHHSNIALVAAARLAGTSSRVFLREATTPSEVRRAGTDLRSRAVGALMRTAYRAADGVIAVSDGVAQDVRTFLGVRPERVHTIYNPVVDDELVRLSREPIDDSWFGLGASEVVLAAGRLAPEKDYPVLIEALALVRRERDAGLVLLGEGPERARLERMVEELGLSDHVKLPGFVSNPFAYMAKASLFALSSLREGLPGVLIQALACGCPVVATDCRSGPREVLEDGKHGELVPVGDAAAMAAAIQRGLAREPDRPALVRRSLDFTVEASVAAYRRLLVD